jgi:hypothetical protein
MNRFVSLSAVVLVVVFAGACNTSGPLRVDKVDPPAGVHVGGDGVVIKGSGFQPGKTQVEVTFGRRKAEQAIISSATEITVVTPAGDKGPVDVTVSFDNGPAFKIPNGFRYIDPQGNGDVRKAFFSGKAGEKK